MADNGFSQTQVVGDPCLPCQQGNLFYLDMPAEIQNNAQISFSVNGKITPILPVDQSYKLLNDLNGTTNALALKLGERSITLIDDIGQCEAPEDLKVVFGTEKPELAFDTNQNETDGYTMIPSQEDIVAIQMRENGLSEGLYDIGEATEEVLDTISDTIFGVFDESADSIIELYETGKELTVSNLPPAIIEVLGANRILNNIAEQELKNRLRVGGGGLSTSNRMVGNLRRDPIARLTYKREFIRAFLKQDLVNIKLFSTGKTVLVFKARSRVRTSFGGFRLNSGYTTSFFESSAKISGGNVASVAGNAIKGASIIAIGLIIYGEVKDFMNEDTGGDWSDLFVGLGVEVSKMVVSAIIGSAITAAIIGLATITAPVWFVIGLGAGISVFVGAIINVIDDNKVKEGMRNAFNNTSFLTRNGASIRW